jgi:hypothetical protein
LRIPSLSFLRNRLGLLVLAALGAGAALGLAAAATHWSLAREEALAEAPAGCLALTGLLLLPASVFPAVMGAMFPRYWRGTPTTVIDEHPMWLLYPILPIVLGYSLTSLVLDATRLLVAPLVVLVGLATAVAVYSVMSSLQLMDPRHVLHLLSRPHQRKPDEAYSDLCRFVGGLSDSGRRALVRLGIERMSELWRNPEVRLEDRRAAKDRAKRILAEIEYVWKGDGYVAEAVHRCRKDMGLAKPSRRLRRQIRHRARLEQIGDQP